MSYNHNVLAGGNEKVAARPSPILTDPTLGSDGFVPSRFVLNRYRISQMTLWRWLVDERMAFPKPVYLGRYRYWRIADIEAWETTQETRGSA